MALIATTAVTLADFAKREDPNGKIDAIVEILTQTNEVLDDMPFVEGNLPTGHKSTIRTGLPQAAWRKLNYGVKPGKSTTVGVTDTCGMLEAYAEVDKALADLNGNTAAFRLSEDRAFLEGMNQEMASTLFYGDTAKDAEKFLGLSARFSTLDKSKAATAANVVDGKGTAVKKLTSIWLVCWGDQTVHGIYPKASKAGLNHKDLGEVTLEDADKGKFQGYRTHYKWDIGLTVRDWRYVVRIANIDLATITNDDLVALMVQAVETIPNTKLGKPVFYMNKETRTRLRLAINKATNVHLSQTEVGGKTVVAFDEIPVRRCDALTNVEEKVV